MMSGNPSWWSINSMYPQSHPVSSQFVFGPSNPNSSIDLHNSNQDFPAVRSWSQLLLAGHSGGAGEEEEKGFGSSSSLLYLEKKFDHWDNTDRHGHHQEHTFYLSPSSARNIPFVGVKQEVSQSSCNQPINCHADDQDNCDHELDHNHQENINISSPSTYSWPYNAHQQQQQLILPLVSSPTSCITSLSSNSILNFSGGNNKASSVQGKNQQHNPDHDSSERNNTCTGGVSKKSRVQQSSAQPALKVRKEKLGDRITALHQLVSPFGKTDTASVLSEAIAYVRFLQGQIEALSSPYMRNGSGSTSHHQQHSVQERNSMFPQAHSQDNSHDGVVKDLRSRGLCLVPISFTQHMTNDNGADYWAQPPFGGDF